LQPLDLYASIEEYLDFDEEILSLYKGIASKAIRNSPKTLIDIGCGQGEFCRIIEANGIKTLGVDLSEKQIEIAKSKGINAQCIDIKDIKEKFDCATAVFDVVNYLPKDYIGAFFSYVYDLLNSNGHFIFDVNTLYGFEEIAQGTLNIDQDDKFIAIDAVFEDGSLFTDITLFSKEDELFKKESGTIRQYYHSDEDLKRIAEDAGFEVVSIEGFNLHSDEEFDKNIIVLYKKG
jgi:cyclopropane fatty-acyl-phospholipid synthase-like methyltransferase